MGKRLLVIENAARAFSALIATAARRRDARLIIEVADAVQEATDALARNGYDAAICWADRSDELEMVVRIRRSAPKLPILLLSPEKDPQFRRLALEKGVSTVLPASKEGAIVLETVLRALHLEQATEQLRNQAARAAQLSREITVLVDQKKAITAESVQLMRPKVPALLPLLVTDDPEQAQVILRAFGEADVPTPLPVLTSSETAIAYLSGKGIGDPLEKALPSLLLLDLARPAEGKDHGPREGCMGLLLWIRHHSAFRHLPVVILGNSVRMEDIEPSGGSRSNTYIIHAEGLTELIELVRALHLYRASLQTYPGR